MATDPAIRDHQAWLGYLQPDGLVVSAAALVDAQAVIDRNTLPLQQRLLPFAEEVEHDEDIVTAIPDFPKFVRGFLEWPDDCLFGLDPARPLPDSLSLPLPELGETLAPTFAFKDPNPKAPETPWLLLVQILPIATDLDAAVTGHEAGWSASRSRRFERLLRETRVPIGLLSNATHIRLMYAPHGENAGSVTFPVGPMTDVAGRPILAAFHLLLEAYRLLAAPTEARLPALLVKSREYQSTVSTALAQQVLDALYGLLRGFQAANDRTRGELLRDLLQKEPDEVYHGLLTVLMRLVFLLFAEDRALLPTSPLYQQHYSVHGLFERLRADAERYPDTMDQRYGAWPQLLALFRTVQRGCRHPQMRMPARSGYLFDPARFPFLEGRTCADPRPPLVSDGIIFRILEKLLLLDGERLSYRTLDVEEIGSVYQTVMGFRLDVAGGPSIAINGKRKHKGEVPAATTINLDDLLAAPTDNRPKWLMEHTVQEVSGEAEKALKSAASLDDVLAALKKKVARNATPHVVPRGGMVLQPTDERRRSGSHYTPRSLTEPIVRTTLRPILERLGEHSTPDQILDLKVCDLAMGSGAFLVEACRQLGDALVKAWVLHGGRPPLPSDETEELLARRLVAQRCLYGADKNPMAVDLAKLSLWLATLARDHPFTFLDHALRPGDSLVGLTGRQIAEFHWKPTDQRVLLLDFVEKPINAATALRLEILAGGDYIHPLLKRQKLDLADQALERVRLVGNLIIAAFFNGPNDRQRQELRDKYREQLTAYYTKPFDPTLRPPEEAKALQDGEFPTRPFHWQIEFPEVFERNDAGFDAIVGNPPFIGGRRVRGGLGDEYFDWLLTLHAESSGNSDLVAHFFRRAFNLLRSNGCFGLIATNTIGQGDTRATGLRWICTHGGTIYATRKRYKWPGQAAVVVSVVHATKGVLSGPFELDGRAVPVITAYLFHAGGHLDPVRLRANESKSFIGSYILGMGFTFDDTDKKGVASPLPEMHRLIAKDPRNAERIFPYIGGEEVNDSPTHAHHRNVINFADFPLRRASLSTMWGKADERQRDEWLRSGVVPVDYPDPVAADWPDLLRIVENRVKPERTRRKPDGTYVLRDPLPQRWWHYADKRPDLSERLSRLKAALVISRVAHQFAFASMPARTVFSDSLVVLPTESRKLLAVVQSRVHEAWARFFGSSMKDDLRYTPSDCFETFPFPEKWEERVPLEDVGQAYHELRVKLMVSNDQGLTATYNQFHDPSEGDPGIARLRELHAEMDQAVLDAYGWTDLRPTCEFILDYEEEGDEGSSKKRKPWRYRWPDPVRDEILARLLALNARRAEEERLSGSAVTAARAVKPKPPRGGKQRSTKPQIGKSLFDAS